MTIPQAAVDAAARAEPVWCGECDPADEVHTRCAQCAGLSERIATAALEAAMPHLRKQIAEEIIAKQASHDNTLRVSPPHFEYGFNTGMKYAARIAEGETK